MTKKIKLPEKETGGTVYRLPMPRDMEGMTPLVIKQHYEIDYIHSFGQDSPFFVGLANGKLFGSQCPSCGYTYATPRGHCMECEEGSRPPG